ncbi:MULTISPECIES: (2Fe-2S)-binding protein [unclassified Halomonas]|uniref:(2Fe-2S)-binding protein n=1 Tax=Halomonas sp. N3-2A TaxID=2014541 RepID=UPI000B5B1554|nr:MULTISPECIES: (2Fe-2S)-binding protein [unclassified Halomonas]ASK20089.1 (2Fe-2S)-binding protein [Halomonas sp. N3-2A]UTD57375.1 (2Fe-2S)-binding protein [Halomonas sp. MS1]
MTLKLTINGHEHELAVPPQTPLLNVLRNDLALNGPKYGCGLGECGACSVLIDGMAARTCVLPVSAAVGHEVTTLDGLSHGGELDPVQQAFVDAQAAQCGYCLNGMIITIRALLNHNAQPSAHQIRTALEHNLCRCGTHVEILQAAERAVVLNAAALQEASHE